MCERVGKMDMTVNSLEYLSSRISLMCTTTTLNYELIGLMSLSSMENRSFLSSSPPAYLSCFHRSLFPVFFVGVNLAQKSLACIH